MCSADLLKDETEIQVSPLGSTTIFSLSAPQPTFDDSPSHTLPLLQKTGDVLCYPSSLGNKGDTHIRTLCEYNLPALTFPSDGFSTDQEWLQAWQKAFDVEEVTDKFFADYQSVFSQVENAVKGIPENEEEARRLYTQRLFNRLMFLRFIEKKGWLTYNGDRDYLRALFNTTAGIRNRRETSLTTGSIGHSLTDLVLRQIYRAILLEELAEIS